MLGGIWWWVYARPGVLTRDPHLSEADAKAALEAYNKAHGTEGGDVFEALETEALTIAARIEYGYIRRRREALKDYVPLVTQADVDNGATFHTVIQKGFELTVLTDDAIGQHFGMSLPSVDRWKNGRTAPHPAMRKHVYAWIEQRARQALETITTRCHVKYQP